MTSHEGAIERTKDGVPIWNGEAGSFQQYEEVCLQWEQGIPWHKRYLCGPRLISELQGTGRKLIVGKRPDWVSYNGGVTHLLSYLRQTLGRPKITDMTDHLNKYFKNTRRRRMESMNDYITRKTEAYARARQALVRVEDHYGERTRTSSRTTRPWDAWSNWEGRRSEEDSRPPGGSTTTPRPEEDEEDEVYASPRQETDSAQLDGGDDPWAQSYWSGWNSSQYHQHYEDENWTTQSKELLPDFLQGWYLLQDASLDAGEKNLVQTAIRGNFGLMRVAQELRNQWPEDDLRKRDQGARQAGMWAQDEALFGDDVEEEDPMAYTYEELVQDGMNEEGLSLMVEAVDEAEMAMNAIHNGKRTLREARAKQHQVKLSRQYYRTTTWKPRTWEKGGKGGPSGSEEKVTCLRCGGKHRTSACPDKQGPRGEQAHQTEEAPFICLAETNEAEMDKA